MKTLYEQGLVNAVRKLMDSSKERIWVSSPYIGEFSAVSRILGKNWESTSSLSIRLLTDLDECSQISFNTLNQFFRIGTIRSLAGLHAKIYIVDGAAIVTSANLTGAGFSKRYEMGVLLQGAEAKDTISQFDHWWKGNSKPVFLEEINGLESKCGSGEPNSGFAKKLSTKWRLPPPSKAKPKFSGRKKLNDYDYFIQCYKELADIYSRIQRLIPAMPINFEIDAMLDYIFHHGDSPSFDYRRIPGETPLTPRRLRNRDAEVSRWAEKFKDWISNDGVDITERMERARIIQRQLNPRSVLSVSWEGLKSVSDCLNCMNSYEINKTRFLNPKNNDLQVIRSNLNSLLHGDEDIKTRFLKCKGKLKYFGDSSAQELVAFYDPKLYPIRNGNSNAGLRYFGYDVSV